MCNLPDAVKNSEVDDLSERAERYLDPALQYACKLWHKHLLDEHTIRAPAVTSALHRFLEKKFLFWLEALSVLSAVRNAVDALQAVVDWLEVRRYSSMLDVLPEFLTPDSGTTNG